MGKFYRLVGHKVKPCSAMEINWGLDRAVALTRIGKADISTVFLPVNHQLSGDDPPLIFETMIFGGIHDGYQTRYSTWEDAKAGHTKAVNLVKSRKVK